jgi:hypothetical protein
MNTFKKLALGLALTGLVVWQAGATVVYNQPTGMVGNDLGGNSSYYEVGNEFQVNTPGIVTQIGMFNPSLSGFGASSISVAIFKDVSGTWSIVAGTLTTFTGSYSAGAYSGDSVMQSITPVSLGAGVYAIVAGGGGTTANPYWNSAEAGSGSTPQTFNSVSGALSQVNQAQWAFAGGSDPSLSAWPGAGDFASVTSPYGAGTFDFAPVPEPQVPGC